MQDIWPFINWASNWHRPTWFSSSWLGERDLCGPGFHESNTVTTPVVGSRLHPITSLSSCRASSREMQMRDRFLLGKAWASPTLVELCHLQSICETILIFYVCHETSTYITACEGLPHNVLHSFSLTNTRVLSRIYIFGGKMNWIWEVHKEALAVGHSVLGGLRACPPPRKFWNLSLQNGYFEALWEKKNKVIELWWYIAMHYNLEWIWEKN